MNMYKNSIPSEILDIIIDDIWNTSLRCVSKEFRDIYDRRFYIEEQPTREYMSAMSIITTSDRYFKMFLFIRVTSNRSVPSCVVHELGKPFWIGCCNAITRSGKRCTRSTSHKYCWQHAQ